jgi:Domain of unknown function (DUF2828)
MATTLGSKGSDVYTYDGVGDPRVALSIILTRGQTEEIITNGMKKILYYSDTKIPDYHKMEEDAFVLAFMNRNIRGGKGERAISYIMFKVLYQERPEIMMQLFSLIPHYGYWGDIFTIWEQWATDEVKACLYDMVKTQLDEDNQNMLEKNSVSLLAKWIPREGREYPDNKIAKEIAQLMFPDGVFSHKMKMYRKLITPLNKYLETVEIKQCDKEWSDIKPETVPGRAMDKYRSAFLNEKKNKEVRYPDNDDRIKCAEHFKEHVNKVLKGDAKINASNVLMVHEIYEHLCVDNLSEDIKNIHRAQWKMIKDDLNTKGIFKNMIAMCDFSGSMDGTPKQVCAAMGLMISELAVGCGKNKIMTFDSTPEWITFPDDMDICDKINITKITSMGQGLSTDFQKAMEVIITDAKKNKTPVVDMPNDLVVFTDMHWDRACDSTASNSYRNNVKTAPWQTHVEMIRESFKRAGEDNFGEGNGYTMPRIVIWNLRPGLNDFHAQADTPGVLNFSGWSQNIFKYLVEKGFTVQTPYDGLRIQLDDSMYDMIRTKIRQIQNERQPIYF